MPFEKFEQPLTPPEEEEKIEEGTEVEKRKEEEEKEYNEKEIEETSWDEIKWEKVPHYKGDLLISLEEEEIKKLKNLGEEGKFLAEKLEKSSKTVFECQQKWGEIFEASEDIYSKYENDQKYEGLPPPLIQELLEKEKKEIDRRQTQARAQNIVASVKISRLLGKEKNF